MICDAIYQPTGSVVPNNWVFGRNGCGGDPIFPGITEDAKTLGVHRCHLYLVLTGQRESKSLLDRYQKLNHGKRGGK